MWLGIYQRVSKYGNCITKSTRLGFHTEAQHTTEVTLYSYFEGAKLTQLIQMRMELADTIVIYSNKIDIIDNELASIGNFIPDLEIKRALLRGLGSLLSVTSKVIRSNAKSISESVAQLTEN